MIEVLQAPEVIAGTSPNEAVHVTFVLDGVTYEYDVPKVGTENGKNKYTSYTTTPFPFIEIVWSSEYSSWYINFPFETGTSYTNTTDSEFPIFDTWTYNVGTELTSLTTTALQFTSKWQAVHHPIIWTLQRKDRLVEEKSIDGAGFVSLLLTTAPPAELQVGNKATYYNPNGTTIGSTFILAISGNRIRLQSIESGVVEGGFVIFDDLYTNYYIETAVMHNGITEIGILKTIPLSNGQAILDVHNWLMTKCDFPTNYPTQLDALMSGKYKLKFRECYNFTRQPYSSLTAFYYWTNSAKQVGDLYGSNMGLYVTNQDIEAKFLSVFNRPTNFIGFPFSLSFIWSELLSGKALRRVVNGSTRMLLTPNAEAINLLTVPNDATSVYIEYGTFSGLPPEWTLDGTLTETKQIKINNECISNPVCLSWVNTLGGREYWVFGYNQQHGLQTSQGATFEPYITDLETARGDIFDIEKFAQPKMTLGATVDNEDIEGLKTILYSICVEMYVNGKWVNVRPETGSFMIRESRDTNTDIELTIQLPYINNQSR